MSGRLYQVKSLYQKAKWKQKRQKGQKKAKLYAFLLFFVLFAFFVSPGPFAGDLDLKNVS